MSILRRKKKWYKRCPKCGQPINGDTKKLEKHYWGDCPARLKLIVPDELITKPKRVWKRKQKKQKVKKPRKQKQKAKVTVKVLRPAEPENPMAHLERGGTTIHDVDDLKNAFDEIEDDEEE